MTEEIEIIDRVGRYIVCNGLDSDSRQRQKVYQRFYLYNYLRRNTELTLTQIGNMFDRDHSSVYTGLVEFGKLTNDTQFYQYTRKVYSEFPIKYTSLYTADAGILELPPVVHKKINRYKNKHGFETYKETIETLLIEKL